MLTYKGMHLRLNRLRGKASTYKCEHCGGQAAHWAYLYNAEDEVTDPKDGPYSPTDMTCYIPLCSNCHRVQERSRRTYCVNGHEYTEESSYWHNGRRRCKTCRKLYRQKHKWYPPPRY